MSDGTLDTGVFDFFASVAIVNCVFGILLNLFLIITVLSSSELRSDARNTLICSISVGDLLMSVLCQPLYADSVFRQGVWVHGCYAHVVVQLLDYFAYHFVTVWGLVSLDILLLTRMTLLTLPLTSRLTSSMTTTAKKRVVMAGRLSLVMFPWMASLLVITPVVVTSLNSFNQTWWSGNRCHFELNVIQPSEEKVNAPTSSAPGSFAGWVYDALDAVFFFLPSCIILVLLGLTACVYITRRRSGKGVQVYYPNMQATPSPTDRLPRPFPTSSSTITLPAPSSESTDTLPTHSSESTDTLSTPSSTGALPTPSLSDNFPRNFAINICAYQRASSLDQDQPKAYVCASLLTLALMGGWHVYRLAGLAESSTVTLVFLIFTALADVKSTMLPLLWLFMLHDVRARARHVIARARNKLGLSRKTYEVEASVAYKNFITVADESQA